MKPYKFPEQKTLFADRQCTTETFSQLIEELSDPTKPFTGFLRGAANDDTLYFLFFLHNEPYAAGKFNGKKCFNITVSEFVGEIFTLGAARLSLHQTDPVLIKSMLIFLQEEPTVKAPANLIDLEQIVRQILSETGDALIVLEKGRMFNFFFVKNGKTAHPHYSDPAWTPAPDLSFEEQLLLYAFETATPPVVAHIYRDTLTSRSSDVEHLDRQKLPGAAPGTAEGKALTVEIVAGAQMGAQLRVPLPCTIGRKDCDIVINDGLVSRLHARFQLIDGQIVVEDLRSTNGTFVNGSAITQAPLAPTDLVTIGNTRLQVS